MPSIFSRHFLIPFSFVVVFFLILLLVALFACKEDPEKEPSYENLNPAGKGLFFASFFGLIVGLFSCKIR
jgi:hypothetical protein